MNLFKSFFVVIIILLITPAYAQTNAEKLCVQISVTIQAAPAQIMLNWINDGSATGFNVFRRANITSAWGTAIATLGSSSATYIDNNVSIGIPYEYKIQKTGTTAGFGYLNAAIELPAIENRGILILVVEDTYIGNTGFDNVINQTIEDIENDGWLVKRLNVNRADAVTSVKASILSIYNQNITKTKGLYIIGHVPVPYSGLMNPDGHGDHLGAWPTDSYYADVNGTWTDVSVNDNTSAAQARNHNIPSDGKFDQGTIGANELQVGRIDFDNLSSFSQTEEELLIKYLNKAHAYKIKGFTANERALIDDNFASMGEGFSSSGLRNFSTMFTPANVSTSLDYRTTTATNSYMWSYGCGAGSYTSCSGIGTTANFSTDSLQTVFTMLFGSYFGDWDSDNNFLRAAIAQGQTLNAFWAGRPQWQVHHMALGENIGFSSLLTQNNSGNYFVSTLPYFGRWIHITLLGDPTTRMHYIAPPSNLMVVNNNNDADLTWTASPDVVLGYNIYRLDPNGDSYTKVNSNIVTTTIFTDNTVSIGGLNTYIVKAVDLKTTASGSYYNQSLGTSGSDNFSVGISENLLGAIKVYPNPVKDKLYINGDNIESYSLFSINGQLISSGDVNEQMIDLSEIKKGLYFINLRDNKGNNLKSKIIIE